MDQIIDKCILLGFGVVLLFGKSGATEPVVVFLIAVVAASLGFYLEEKKYIYIIFAIIFLVTIVQPMCLIFFPVFLYDALAKKLYWAVLPELLLAFVHPVFSRPEQWILWSMTGVLAAALCYKTIKKQYFQEELIRIRDSSTELNIILKEKNKSLMEKQDYEVYLATLKERNRIAREIHDNVGHMLSRSLLLTGALLTVEKEGMVHDQLENMRDTLDQAMTSIRQSVHDLHDDAIDLKQAVTEIVQTIETDYEVKLDYDMSGCVPRQVKYCLIATVKEAVSNIIKHSNGIRVRISFREHPGFYQLSVEDNGKDVKMKVENGIGLSNMQERVDALQGTFRVHTEKGFCIFITIPKVEENLCE